MPKNSKIKENNDVDDEYDVVPLPMSTTVTESQPTVTCSTSYNWSATPLASLDHSCCMNEENMSFPSYSDLADEIKALKIENNILKDKIKASKQPIKVLVQRHDKFTWKKCIFIEATKRQEITHSFGKFFKNTCERIHFSNALGV